MELPAVSITSAQLTELRDITRKGTHNAREICRAQILLLAHERLKEETIARRVRRHVRTVRRVVARFNEHGLHRALADLPRSGKPRKTTVVDDAHLTAIACTKAPEGSEHWTLDLLAERFEKDRKKSLSRNVIWLRLSQRGIKPWREKNVVHPEDHARIRRTHGRRARSVRASV
jgi:transposase